MKIFNKPWKKAAGIATAAALAAGIIIGGVFNSTGDLLEKNDKALPAPPAVVELLQTDADPDDEGTSEAQPEEKKKSLRERIRAAILSLPVWVRAVVCLPLWCAGQILIYAAGLLWETLLSPVAAAILRWLCFALIVAAVVFAVLKLLFPELKLKEIFSKKNLIILLAGTVLTAIADIVLQASEAQSWTMLLAKALGTLIILAAIVLPIIIRNSFGNNKKASELIPAGGA